MSSRKTHKGAEKVYSAAEKWVDCALRNDDSLFTPGKPIWSSDVLIELRSRFLDHPDVGEGDFYGKLKAQLDGCSAEAYQLMAEALYIHFLFISESGMRRDTKKNRVEQVLGWGSPLSTIPSDLVEGLSSGLGGPGQQFFSARPFHVGFIIEFVDQCKALTVDERHRLLDDPWGFKEFVGEIDLQAELFKEKPTAHRAQIHALLHLVFPGTFEGIVSENHKTTIANAPTYADYIVNPTDDLDRQLAQIRAGLERKFGADFDFYGRGVGSEWITSDDQPEDEDPADAPNDDLTKLADETHLTPEFLSNIRALLEDKKQVIFQGPPGTGKTYIAQKLAKHLAGSEERVTLVQFHPSYAYEDFVRGYRPKLVDGETGYELKDGPLLRVAERARKYANIDHFLVIDEINRGNIAKVFGELYFLLEYRDQAMNLQYQQDDDEVFSLPSNLFIIGTMNTADRSIALVDLALRRRFYFVEFHPDEEPVKSVLRRWLKAYDKEDLEWVADVVERANEKLSDDRHAAIGPSYFIKENLDENAVARIWKHSVLPYIEERLFSGDEVSDEFGLENLRNEIQSTGNSADSNGEQTNENGIASDASD